MSVAEPFPFEQVEQLAKKALMRHRGHRDYEDLISETVLAVWKVYQRLPHVSLATIVHAQAHWMEAAWWRSGACGDVIANDRSGRIAVQPVAWEAHGEEAVELSNFVLPSVPDFSEALIEQFTSPPPDPNEGEIHYTAWEKRRQQEEARRAASNDLYARCREEERRFGEELLAHGNLLSHHREAIRLRYIEGKSIKAAAAAVDIHWTCLSHAIRRAKGEIEAGKKQEHGKQQGSDAMGSAQVPK